MPWPEKGSHVYTCKLCHAICLMSLDHVDPAGTWTAEAGCDAATCPGSFTHPRPVVVGGVGVMACSRAGRTLGHDDVDFTLWSGE